MDETRNVLWWSVLEDWDGTAVEVTPKSPADAEAAQVLTCLLNDPHGPTGELTYRLWLKKLALHIEQSVKWWW